MAKKRLIPFSWMPGSWGLKGKTYERAKAEYDLDGYDREIKLAELDLPDGIEKQKELIRINSKYGKITEYEMESEIAKLLKDDNSIAKAQLEIDLRHHKINENEYQKRKATINKEPWVSVVNIGLNKDKPTIAGELELDWNDEFVNKLKQEGHIGPSDYAIVEQWFNLFCAAVAAENGIVINPDTGPSGDELLPPGIKEYF